MGIYCKWKKKFKSEPELELNFEIIDEMSIFSISHHDLRILNEFKFGAAIFYVYLPVSTKIHLNFNHVKCTKIFLWSFLIFDFKNCMKFPFIIIYLFLNVENSNFISVFYPCQYSHSKESCGITKIDT